MARTSLTAAMFRVAELRDLREAKAAILTLRAKRGELRPARARSVVTRVSDLWRVARDGHQGGLPPLAPAAQPVPRGRDILIGILVLVAIAMLLFATR